MQRKHKFLLLILSAALFGACSDGQSTVRGTATSKWSWKSAVKSAVTDVLLDAATAEFRLPSLATESNPTETGEVAYCGLVNARNSIGAYAGDQIFVVSLYKREKALDRNRANILAVSDSSLPISNGLVPTKSAAELLELCESAGYSYEVLLNAKKS